MKLSSRIVSKHALPSEWYISTLVPLKGEQIIYDAGNDPVDGNYYSKPRIKVGDGVTVVNELPFINGVSATVSKTSKTVITGVELPSMMTEASYTPSSMSQALSIDDAGDGTLTVVFNSGSFVPATYRDGSVSSDEIEYVTDVNVTSI